MKLKNFTLSICSAIVTATVFSQPAIVKQKTIGGNNYDYFTDLGLTKDGGIIVGGSSYSNQSGEKTNNSKGSVDYWIVKLNHHNKIQWDKTIGGNDGDGLESLQQTNDGSYILGGSSFSGISGDKTEKSRGSNDYWVVYLDSSGKTRWDKTIGGSNLDYLKCIKQTRAGGFILGGHSNSNISAEKSENSRGSYDYWLVKLNDSGHVKWDKTIGGNNWDLFTSLQQTTDGGYILGGYSNSGISGEKTDSSRGGYDYWIVKLDSLKKYSMG